MSEENRGENSPPPPLRVRKCPSCQTPAKAFLLSALPLPIEQASIPWMVAVDKEIGFTVRSFGATNMNELQFLAFTNICQTCGHISWWDIPTEELEWMLNHPNDEAYIHWTYQPQRLLDFEKKLSPDKKWIVSKLLENLKIGRNGDEHS